MFTSRPRSPRGRVVCLGLAVAASLGWSAVACGPGGGPEQAAKDTGTSDATYSSRGEELYRASARDLFGEGNSFSCSTCHALKEPAADGMVRPGHPIGNATRRPSYKNGQFQKMLPAVNSCRTEWMNLDPWKPSNDDWKTLRAWLDSQATQQNPDAISYDIIEPPADLSGGDAMAGKRFFNNGCAICHGRNGQGSSKGIPLQPDQLTPEYVASRIRKSGEPDSEVYGGKLEGGQMPFWSKQRLPDETLKDIVAYLAQGEPSPDAGMDAGSTDDTGDGKDTGTSDTTPDCQKPSCKIGWTAKLKEKFHNVGGTAEIVDKRTIKIRNFTYDGRGLTVVAYGAPKYSEQSFRTNGFAISKNLKRSQPYTGETLTLKLPEGSDTSPKKTLLDLGAISIWCVDVGQDFGSGKFTP